MQHVSEVLAEWMNAQHPTNITHTQEQPDDGNSITSTCETTTEIK